MHTEHRPSMPRAMAQEYELEEIHECLDEILMLLAEMRDLLEELVVSQT